MSDGRDEISKLLADELKFYEEGFERLSAALDELLDYKADYRACVLRMIAHQRGRWEPCSLRFGVSISQKR